MQDDLVKYDSESKDKALSSAFRSKRKHIFVSKSLAFQHFEEKNE